MADHAYEEFFNCDVVDKDGEKVGSVGQVYLDDQTRQPSWITVKTGLFGLKETFVPLEKAVISHGKITAPYDSQKMKDAPRVDPDTHLDADAEAELYTYYGIADIVAVAPKEKKPTNETTAVVSGSLSAQSKAAPAKDSNKKEISKEISKPDHDDLPKITKPEHDTLPKITKDALPKAGKTAQADTHATANKPEPSDHKDSHASKPVLPSLSENKTEAPSYAPPLTHDVPDAQTSEHTQRVINDKDLYDAS